MLIAHTEVEQDPVFLLKLCLLYQSLFKEVFSKKSQSQIIIASPFISQNTTDRVPSMKFKPHFRVMFHQCLYRNLRLCGNYGRFLGSKVFWFELFLSKKKKILVVIETITWHGQL